MWVSHSYDGQAQRGICNKNNSLIKAITVNLLLNTQKFTIHMAYLSESVLAEVWNDLQMGITSCLSFSLISSDSRKELATLSRASSGHGYQERAKKGIVRIRSKDESFS